MANERKTHYAGHALAIVVPQILSDNSVVYDVKLCANTALAPIATMGAMDEVSANAIAATINAGAVWIEQH